MIKDSEIEGLKKILKELRETIEQNDTSKELQELKKQNQFLGKEKDMKDLMIDQLKKEMEKQIKMFMEAKEKEAQLAKVIQTLTMQNEMIATQNNAPPKQSPQVPKKQGTNRFSLI